MVDVAWIRVVLGLGFVVGLDMTPELTAALKLAMLVTGCGGWGAARSDESDSKDADCISDVSGSEESLTTARSCLIAGNGARTASLLTTPLPLPLALPFFTSLYTPACDIQSED